MINGKINNDNEQERQLTTKQIVNMLYVLCKGKITLFKSKLKTNKFDSSLFLLKMHVRYTETSKKKIVNSINLKIYFLKTCCTERTWKSNTHQYKLMKY